MSRGIANMRSKRKHYDIMILLLLKKYNTYIYIILLINHFCGRGFRVSFLVV